MPSNIEIKALVKNMSRLRELAKHIATEPVQILHQEDIFYKNKVGRLKLRILSDNLGILIHYERPDSSDAKLSKYLLYKTSNPAQLKLLLSTSLDEIVTVKKVREVYIVDQTRIHLDEVEQLGSFMEIEVVLTDNQTPSEGKLILSALMKKLEINKNDLISVAYADLLISKQQTNHD